MTRDTIPLSVADLSAFSRALARQLAAAPGLPSHLALMNMLARAGGFRNYQHLRASHAAGARMEAAPPPEAPADLALAERAINQFDRQGRLKQWPARRNVQVLCLWALWSRLPRGQVMTERQVSDLLRDWHLFHDPAILRRDMVEMGLLSRREGMDYRRVEQAPPATALALIRQLA